MVLTTHKGKSSKVGVIFMIRSRSCSLLLHAFSDLAIRWRTVRPTPAGLENLPRWTLPARDWTPNLEIMTMEKKTRTSQKTTALIWLGPMDLMWTIAGFIIIEMVRWLRQLMVMVAVAVMMVGAEVLQRGGEQQEGGDGGDGRPSTASGFASTSASGLDPSSCGMRRLPPIWICSAAAKHKHPFLRFTTFVVPPRTYPYPDPERPLSTSCFTLGIHRRT